MINNFYVYEIQYPDGTPFYVGKGKGKRMYIHLKKNDDKNKLKQNIINKIRRNGNEPITITVVNDLTEDKAYEIEKSLITHYGRRNIGTGILSNLTDGGEGVSGWTHSLETKRRLSKTSTNNKNALGHKVTDEVKLKISESNKGLKRSDEVKLKMSAVHKGELNGFYGKVHSEETKLKMSIAAKSRVSTHKKVVVQFDLNDILLREYESAREAERSSGVDYRHISACCLGKQKSAKGFIWKFKGEIDE